MFGNSLSHSVKTMLVWIGLSCICSVSVAVAECGYPSAEIAADEESQPKIAVMPTFRGGDIQVFRRWLQEQMRMPEEALKRGAVGRLEATFVIEEDGTLDSIRVVRSPHWSLSREVFRVLQRSDKWSPGRDENGNAVRVRCNLPIDFKIAPSSDSDPFRSGRKGMQGW